MSATFSECRTYRYDFIKRWSTAPLLMVVGHNPSIAGQVKCPRCGVPAVPGLLTAVCGQALCGYGWTRPGDGSDELDDPTVRKCALWARRDGFGGLVMANACAAIGTEPKTLDQMADPVGPLNDVLLLAHARCAGSVLIAWGQLAKRSPNPSVRARPDAVLRLLGPEADLYVVKLSKDGTPWHPLYLPNATTLQLWRKRTG